jgi:AbrB family looped-hinge helix DNA binding protein
MELKNMQPIGTVRKIGKEGRICITAEAREVMDINEGDLVEQILYKQDDGERILVLRKYKG